MRRAATLTLALLVGGCGAGVLPPIHSEAERLEVARQLHDKGEYSPAADLLTTYVSQNMGSADVDEAIYLLGDCKLKTKDWSAATSEFERVLRDFPESDSAASARFGLGEAQFAQSRPPDFDQEFTLKALATWQRYLEEYPGHWRNAEAQQRVMACRTRLADKLMRTGRLYLKLRLPEPARIYFDKIATDYADTVWSPEAELEVAMCDIKLGKRTEAIEQLKGIEERHAGRPIAERAARERKRLEHS